MQNVTAVCDLSNQWSKTNTQYINKTGDTIGCCLLGPTAVSNFTVAMVSCALVSYYFFEFANIIVKRDI